MCLAAEEGGLLPADKAAIIAQLQDGGERVLVIGDGVNDAPSLATPSWSVLPHGLTAAADIRTAMRQRDKAAAGFEAAGKLAQARVHPSDAAPGVGTRRQCILLSMVRKQMYIDEELNDGLRRLAARTGRPEAEHVREALRRYLGTAHYADTGDADPLLELVGLVGDVAGPADVALHHDDYLYGAGRTA